MKKIFEFECTSCSEVFEEYTEYKKETECPLCNSKALKLISTPRVSLEGYSGSFPGAAMAWEKRHRPIANQKEPS